MNAIEMLARQANRTEHDCAQITTMNATECFRAAKNKLSKTKQNAIAASPLGHILTQ